MGKKLQGAKLRAKKRQRALVDELQERQAEQIAKQPIVEKPDEALFVVDTTGDTVPRNQRPTAVPAKKKVKKGTVWSENEKKEMEKLMKRHSKEELAEIAKRGERLFDKSNHLRTHGIHKSKENRRFDLWDDFADAGKKDALPAADAEKKADGSSNNEAESKPVVFKGKAPAGTHTPLIPLDGGVKNPPRAAPKNLRPTVKPVAVDVAKSGQSYRPDPSQHQMVLRQALAVEERRNLAEEIKNAPISPGMSESTKALLLEDSDSSDEDDDDDDGNDGNNEGEEKEGRNGFHKKRDKLTRAQRNKQKRVRIEERERLNAKKRRVEENAVYQAKRIKKELDEKEKTSQQRQEEKRKLAEERAADDKGKNIETRLSEHDPIAAPTFPVALSSEVEKGTLRTMIPKGDLVTDRMASFAMRKLAARLPSGAAASQAALERKRRTRSKKKVKGAKEWEGEDFVITK